MFLNWLSGALVGVGDFIGYIAAACGKAVRSVVAAQAVRAGNRKRETSFSVVTEFSVRD